MRSPIKGFARLTSCLPLVLILLTVLSFASILFWATKRDNPPPEKVTVHPLDQAATQTSMPSMLNSPQQLGSASMPDTKNDHEEPAYGLDLFEAAEGVQFFTDKPRNQSTVNMDAARWEDILTEYKYNKVGVTDGIWMPITGVAETQTKGGFVYSAFFDNRPDPPHVLVLGIVPNNTETLFCRFHHEGKYTQQDTEKRSKTLGLLPTTVVESRKVEAQWPQLMRRPFPVLAVFIKCPLIWDQAQREKESKLKIPASVSLYPDGESAWKEERTGNNLLIIKKEKRRSESSMETRVNQPKKLTFCPKHLWRVYSDVVMLVEFMELHSLLGVSHFHFYGHTYSPQVECILKNHYAKMLGNSAVKVELHNWELPFTTQQNEAEPSDVAQAEPESAMNDCLYRSIASGVEFVANGDLDDAFIPRSHSGPGALLKFFESTLKVHPTAGAFEFRRPQFAREFQDDEGYLDSLLISSPKGGGEIPLRTMRKTRLQLYIDAWPKIAVVAERVYGMQTHWVYSFLRGYSPVIVDKQAATVHHFRLAGKGLTPSDWNTGVMDHSAHAFRKLLADRVERFLQLVPKECNVTRELWDSDKP